MKAAIIASIASAILLSSCAGNGRPPNPLQAEVKQGILEGVAIDSVVTAFLGVPFAQPPVGDLRWKEPQPPGCWDGVRPARDFGPDPMQLHIFGDMVFRGNGASEDCLYLNIWTPAKSQAENLPVLIYFNGGGLIAGSGSEPRYDGAAMARNGVVAITANYREGIFGFFAHPGLSAEAPYHGSGNYGYLDQVAAIKWVKDNIKAFGGNPSRITIAGESAGSFSVSLLMVSPLSKHLIAGAILSSGAEVMPSKPSTLAEAEAEGAEMLKSKGIQSLADARNLPAKQLLEMFRPQMRPSVLDGYFMEEPSDSVFARGGQAKVPLLAGWNSLEGAPQASTLEEYKNVLRPKFGDMTDEIFEAYCIKCDSDVMAEPGFQLASDQFTGFGTWKVADYHASTSKCPVYRYKYNHPRPLPVANSGGGNQPEPKRDLGAVHSADIEYALGNLDLNHCFGWQPEDYEISRIFTNFYANFCKSGNPNGPTVPPWTPASLNRENPLVMQIDVETRESSSPQVENAYRTLEKFYRR